jgi:phosphoglycolate phosphatase
MRDEGGRMKATDLNDDSNVETLHNNVSSCTEVPSSSFILPPSSLRNVPPSSLRILLWDIDGTLIHSLRAGGYKEYMIPAVEHVFGTAGRLAQMRVSGMTDLQIIAEALRDEGFSNERLSERVDQLRERYMIEIKRVTGNGVKFFEVLPGVRELLEKVAAHPHYRSALLTGNIEPVAYWKMGLVGLSDFFTLPGAFGDESHNRNDLPALAAERINKHLQVELEPHQFIIIGDTPNDIACARHFGARSLAVGTGRFYSEAEILTCKPDAWLPDLSDTEQVMKTLAGL